MFSSSNGSKKPVQQVGSNPHLKRKTKADQSFSNVGDGASWLVHPRQKLPEGVPCSSLRSSILDIANWCSSLLERSEYAQTLCTVVSSRVLGGTSEQCADEAILDLHLLSGGADLPMDAVILPQRSRLENLDWLWGPHILTRTC
jgi:hypothetical protein